MLSPADNSPIPAVECGGDTESFLVTCSSSARSMGSSALVVSGRHRRSQTEDGVVGMLTRALKGLYGFLVLENHLYLVVGVKC